MKRSRKIERKLLEQGQLKEMAQTMEEEPADKNLIWRSTEMQTTETWYHMIDTDEEDHTVDINIGHEGASSELSIHHRTPMAMGAEHLQYCNCTVDEDRQQYSILLEMDRSEKPSYMDHGESACISIKKNKKKKSLVLTDSGHDGEPRGSISTSLTYSPPPPPHKPRSLPKFPRPHPSKFFTSTEIDLFFAAISHHCNLAAPL